MTLIMNVNSYNDSGQNIKQKKQTKQMRIIREYCIFSNFLYTELPEHIDVFQSFIRLYKPYNFQWFILINSINTNFNIMAQFTFNFYNKNLKTRTVIACLTNDSGNEYYF